MKLRIFCRDQFLNYLKKLTYATVTTRIVLTVVVGVTAVQSHRAEPSTRHTNWKVRLQHAAVR